MVDGLAAGRVMLQARAAQRIDTTDAALAQVQRPFTEAKPVNGHQRIHQLQHVPGKGLVARTGH